MGGDSTELQSELAANGNVESQRSASLQMEPLGSVRLKSPKLPLFPAHASLLNNVLDASEGAAPRSGPGPLFCAAQLVVHSAAEAPALYVQKDLNDAFKPLNCSISVVRAPAAACARARTGSIPP